jgi:hypothetical protein
VGLARHRRRPRINAASVPMHSLHDFKQPRKTRIANGLSTTALSVSLSLARHSFLPSSFDSLITTRHSQHASSRSPPPMRGGRSAVALGCLRGTLSARCDRRAVAPLDHASRHTVLAFFAHPGRTRLAIDFTHQANPMCVGHLRSQRRGRSPFGAPRGIFRSGPVLAVVRPAFAEATAGYGTARQSLGGGAAFPPGSCVAARVIVTRRSGSLGPPRGGR